MSKLSTAAKAKTNERKFNELKPVTNFMNGISYEMISPLETLKLVAASSIFGEPAYYRDGEFKKSYLRRLNEYFSTYSIFTKEMYDSKTTSDVMIDAIRNALDYDFGATLRFAIELRTDYYMRLNPQVILVEASIHPKRQEWTNENPGKFSEYALKIMLRADEPASQLSYWLYQNNGSISNIPNILKKAWAKKLSTLSRYEINKYKNAESGMINAVRVSHANSTLLNELMKTGTIEVSDSEKTWENLRSEGKSWVEILETTKVPHMALLRNLRNIFTEIDDRLLAEGILNKLVADVKYGKQFPFRYFSAYRAIEHASDINFKPMIMDKLEECIDISRDNLPKLKGRTLVLSDNSGSAWGSFSSEYGTVTVAEIGNLSALIFAANSDEGHVGIFGDRLDVVPVSKRNGTLIQLRQLNTIGKGIGGATEHGIWIALDKAIQTNEHWDNIVIFSDMQAGHGKLYGVNTIPQKDRLHGTYVDVYKMISEYRKRVNPKLNVFSVQTGGYDNSVMPEYAYRGANLAGWTGKELLFADKLIETWDEIEKK